MDMEKVRKEKNDESERLKVQIEVKTEKLKELAEKIKAIEGNKGIIKEIKRE